MKIEDLAENINVANIKVKLPENILETANTFGNDIPEEVWLVGPMMGDWFIKINKTDTRIYPLFRDFIPYEELKEWEVVEIYKE